MPTNIKSLTLDELRSHLVALRPMYYEYLATHNWIVKLEHDLQGSNEVNEVVVSKHSAKRPAKPTVEEVFVKRFSQLTPAQQEALLKEVDFNE